MAAAAVEDSGGDDDGGVEGGGDGGDGCGGVGVPTFVGGTSGWGRCGLQKGENKASETTQFTAFVQCFSVSCLAVVAVVTLGVMMAASGCFGC